MMMQMSLNRLATVIMGKSPDSATYNTRGEDLPFFQGKAEFGSVYPTPSKWSSKPLKIAEADDILISVRAPGGPTNVAQERCCIGLGRGLAAIRPFQSLIDRDYLWLFLKYIEPSLAKKGQGSTVEAISGTDLASFAVPVPPIDQQCRIAARLRAQLADIERLPSRLLARAFGETNRE